MSHPDTIRAMRRALVEENRKWGNDLRPVPKDMWPQMVVHESRLPVEMWRSRKYLVTVFPGGAGTLRLTVCRAAIGKHGEWVDGISWDELQEIKRAVGYGHRDAVEVYPADRDIVNVANMRHLWVLPDELPFKWKEKRAP